MKGSIRFDNEINVEVAVDPSQDEGAKLLSAVNLVDGQELGSGGGDLSYVTVTLDLFDYVQETPIEVVSVEHFESQITPSPDSSLTTTVITNCEVVNNSIRIPYDRSAINAIYLFELVAFNADDTGYVFDADNSPFTVEGNAELVSRPNAQATFTGDFTIHMGLHVD